MNNRQVSLFAGGLWVKTVLVCLLAGVLLAPAIVAGEQPENKHTIGTTLSIEGGYFYPRRGSFRDLYGSGLCLGAAFNHTYQNKWGWGVTGGYGSLSKEDSPLSYWNVTVVPQCTYTVTRMSSTAITLGGGVGYSYRKVTYTIPEIPGAGVGEYWQSESSVVAQLSVRLGVRATRDLSVGARLCYDHHFFSDPTVGNFGDTGGFHLRAHVGFAL